MPTECQASRAWHSVVVHLSAVRMRRAAAMTMFLVVASASPAGAASISVPPPKNLGSVPTGTSTFSAQLGTVTASASGILGVAPSFTATVSATVFRTGGGGPSETVAKASIRYWSGPATAFSGALVGGFTAGQPTAALAQDLSVARVAFSGSALAGTISASWNPTIVINLPASAVAGSYSGTITHSVA